MNCKHSIGFYLTTYETLVHWSLEKFLRKILSMYSFANVVAILAVTSRKIRNAFQEPPEIIYIGPITRKVDINPSFIRETHRSFFQGRAAIKDEIWATMPVSYVATVHCEMRLLAFLFDKKPDGILPFMGTSHRPCLGCRIGFQALERLCSDSVSCTSTLHERATTHSLSSSTASCLRNS